MTFLQTLFPELYQHTSLDTVQYNLIQGDESEFILELNVAGFSDEEIDVEIADKVLTVSASKKRENRKYLYCGADTSSFVRRFNLRDDVEVKAASTKNGLLSIVLETKIPEHKKPRKIFLTH